MLSMVHTSLRPLRWLPAAFAVSAQWYSRMILPLRRTASSRYRVSPNAHLPWMAVSDTNLLHVHPQGARGISTVASFTSRLLWRHNSAYTTMMLYRRCDSA